MAKLVQPRFYSASALRGINFNNDFTNATNCIYTDRTEDRSLAMKTIPSDDAASSVRSKPYMIVGAGHLSAALWKHGEEISGWEYQFTVFSLNGSNGAVAQCFSASDVIDLAKLAHVLAAVLVDDGCLAPKLRAEIQCLQHALESIFCPETEKMS